MTDLFFLRHAEATTNLHLDRISGRSSEAPLTTRGIEQAALLGRHLVRSSAVIDAVYSSNAVRTRRTASLALAEAKLAHDIVVDERIHEVSQGQFEGQSRAHIYTPSAIALHQINELDGALPGAESIQAAGVRMMDFVDEIHQLYPDGTLLVFSHGLAIRTLVGTILGYTKQQILEMKTSNVSVTHISVNAGRPTVHYVGKKVISE